MNVPSRLALAALLVLPSAVLLVPAASADPVCLVNRPDGVCLVRVDVYPTSIFSYCATLLVDPPLPGMYTYVASCSPNVCAYPEIRCPRDP